MSLIRTLGGMAAAAADGPGPAPLTQKLKIDQNSQTSYVNIATLWDSTLSEFAWTIDVEGIEPWPLSFPTVWSNWGQGGAGQFMLRYSNNLWNQPQAIGDTHSGSILLQYPGGRNVRHNVGYRFVGGVDSFLIADDGVPVEDAVAATASLAGPSGTTYLGGPNTGGSDLTSCYISNFCVWLSNVPTKQQIRDICAGILDGRTLNPTHQWDLSGDYIDRGSVGGKDWGNVTGDCTFVDINE